MRPRFLVPLMLFGGAFVFLAGCSNKVGPSVKGQVLLDGQPVSEARIVFEGKGGASTITDAEGKFFLDGTVYKNVKPGKYLVRVSKFADKKTGKVPPPEDYEQLVAAGMVKSMLPEKYDGTDQNPLNAEIKDGHNDLPPFQLKSK